MTSQRSPWTRLRLTFGPAAAAIILALGGIGIVAAADPPTTSYTGCLNRTTGIPYNVRAGTTPIRACLSGDPQASWSNIGPAGAAGLPGAPGAPGHDGEPGRDGASLSAVPLPAGDARCPSGGVEIVQVQPGPTQISQGVICNGAEGDQGEPGEDGAPGTGGLPTGYSKTRSFTVNPAPPFSLATNLDALSIDLPAGTYMMFGKIDVVSAATNSAPDFVACFLGNDGAGTGQTTLVPHSAETITTTAMLTLTSPTTVHLMCFVLAGGGTGDEITTVNTASIRAITLDTIVRP